MTLKEKDLLELVTYLGILLERVGDNVNMTEADARRLLTQVKNYLYRNYRFADDIERMPLIKLVARRVVPLFVTMFVALGTASVLMHFETTLGKLAKFFVFAPLVSAVCGNNGLQTGTIMIRALAVGHRREIIKALLKELTVGLCVGLLTGTVGGLVASLILQDFRVFAVVGTALFAGILTSTLMGTLMPVVFERLNIDPALTVGPAETTLQDIVSYTVYLMLLKTLLS